MTNGPGPRSLAAASLLVLGGVLALAAWAVVYPYQTSYVEGYLLEQGQRMADGGGFYRDLGQEPYIVDNFPPVYPALMAVGVLAFGTTFAFGRVLSVLAVVGLGLVAWRFHRGRLPPAHTLAWIALWAVSPYVLRRALLVRMDFAAILLAALGVGVYLGFRGRGRWSPFLAVPFFAAAVLTRQTMLVAPAAVVVAAWWHGRRRDAVLVAGGLAAALAVAVAAIWAWEPGFLLHTVVYNTGRYDIGDAVRAEAAFLGLHAALILPAALGAYVLARRGLRGKVLAVWWLLAWLASWTVGKPGSTYNHFLEVLFVSLLVAPAGLLALVGGDEGVPARLRMAAAWIARRPAPVALLALLLVQAILTAASNPLHTGVAALSDHDEDAALVAALEGIDGPIVSENAGAAVQAGHTLVIEPRTLLELHLAGLWDESDFVASLQDRSYAALVLERADGGTGREGFRFSEAAWQAIEDGYAPAQDFGQYRIWRPR